MQIFHNVLTFLPKTEPAKIFVRPVLRCAGTAVIPMLWLNCDFRAWAKKRRERPVQEHPLNGREVVGAVLNKLLRLAFALAKNQVFY